MKSIQGHVRAKLSRWARYLNRVGIEPNWGAAAEKLEPFSDKPGVWKAWAEVGWLILDRGKDERLFDSRTRICNVRKSRKDPYFGKEHSSRSIAEQDIREALFDAFHVIATGESRRKKQRQKTTPTNG